MAKQSSTLLTKCDTRPTGRIAKLSRTHNIVVLETMEDGTFKPVGLEGFKFNPQVEKDVESFAMQMESQMQEEKSNAELTESVEALSAAGKLNRKAMGNFASQYLGYKNVNLSAAQRELVRLVELSRARIWDYHQIMRVAEIIAKKQRSYLESQDDLDKAKITYAEVASHFDDVSEATIRRLIKDIRLKIGTWTIAARDLITQSSMTEIYREIVALREVYPHAGAPKLHTLLRSKGMDVSRRTVGSALSTLNKSIFLL